MEVNKRREKNQEKVMSGFDTFRLEAPVITIYTFTYSYKEREYRSKGQTTLTPLFLFYCGIISNPQSFILFGLGDLSWIQIVFLGFYLQMGSPERLFRRQRTLHEILGGGLGESFSSFCINLYHFLIMDSALNIFILVLKLLCNIEYVRV